MFSARVAGTVTAIVFFSSCLPNISMAGSLAGQVGNKRYPTDFSFSVGPCGKAFKNYVAAGGHSAYAATPRVWGTETFFCGTSYNAPSQKAAEEHALASCKATGKKYKMQVTGPCQIYASK